MKALGSLNSLLLYSISSQFCLRALIPELVVSIDVPGSDAHQLVQVGGGGGDEVHPGAVDVHLVEDALPGDLGPQEAPTLERKLTSLIPNKRKT